jgi:site-specific recombinase XerC
MLGSLVSLYLTHLQAEGVSPHTLRWHQGCLKRFGQWLTDGGHPENPEKWNAALVRAYIVALQTSPGRKAATFSPHAVQSYVRSLRAFCQWAVDDELIPVNPMTKVKQPKAPALVKPTVTNAELSRLLEAAKDGRTVLRDTALLLFMLDSGVRAAEVCGLRATDIY